MLESSRFLLIERDKVEKKKREEEDQDTTTTRNVCIYEILQLG